MQIQQGIPAQTQQVMAQRLPGQAIVQRQGTPLPGTQLQMIRNQMIVQQSPTGQMVGTAGGVQSMQQNTLQAAQLASAAQTVAVHPTAGVQTAAAIQQRMVFPANAVSVGMQMRPGFPAQGNDLIAAAAAAQQQQQQQQQRKLFEAQMIRQQQQQQQLQQDPARQKQVQKAVLCLALVYEIPQALGLDWVVAGARGWGPCSRGSYSQLKNGTPSDLKKYAKTSL